MAALKRNWSGWVILFLAVAALYLRLQIYGDLRLSIANNDTASYVSSSEVKFPSWEAFTGRRLFTTNLLYRVFWPERGYEILVNGSGETSRRQIQPTFVGIALLQNLVSLLSWSFLTLILANRLTNRGLQILAALVIPAFAFTPQLADWDSILTSESLTFSLFALQFGLLALLIFRLFENPVPTRTTLSLVLAWLTTVFFWTFLKDGNLFNLAADGLAVGGLLAFKSFRKRKPTFLILTVLGALACFFALAWGTSGQSVRSEVQLRHVYDVNLLPAPARVAFLNAQGMPDPSSAEFNVWFGRNAQLAYIKFLLTHPGYVLSSYTRDGLASFASGLQPYFDAPELTVRENLIPFGEMLHPPDPSPLLADWFLLLGIWVVALRKRSKTGLIWAWLASWLLLGAHLNLFITVFGDTYALTRHALQATTSFRLFMWLYMIVLIDLALMPGQGALAVQGEQKSPAA